MGANVPAALVALNERTLHITKMIDMEQNLDNTENPQHDAKLPTTGSNWEGLKDWGYEEDDYVEEDETLFGIENNFPPSDMTEREWNKARE